MGGFRRKSSRGAREDSSRCSKCERAVRVAEALHQPAAEEAGAASDEHLLAAHLLPQRSRSIEYPVEIAAEYGLHRHGFGMSASMDQAYSMPTRRHFAEARDARHFTLLLNVVTGMSAPERVRFLQETDPMRIIIFGAGSALSDFLSILPAAVEVVAVCDNDRAKHGKIVMGHRIAAPETIKELAFDFVVVTTRSGAAIRAQLLQSGLPEAKILLFYSNFDSDLRTMVNHDMDALNRHLGLGLHPLSLCTMQLWPENGVSFVSCEDDFCRMMAFKLASDRILANEVPGSIAELGVYRGELASILNKMFSQRMLYLFDTFEGFSANDLSGDAEIEHSQAVVGDFQDTDVNLVIARMPHPEKVVIRKGYFPETTEGLEERFALVSLDVDLYRPTLAGLEYFYPRLSPGGCIFVHDYNNRRFKGVRSAVDEFTATTGASLVQLPDLAGTAIVSK